MVEQSLCCTTQVAITTAINLSNNSAYRLIIESYHSISVILFTNNVSQRYNYRFFRYGFDPAPIYGE
jgi:hypothetical protein